MQILWWFNQNWVWPLCEGGILKTIKIPFSCEEKKVKQCCKNRRGLSGVEELHKIGIFPYMSRLDISCSRKVNYSQELQALDLAIATSFLLKWDKNGINNPTNIHTNNWMTIGWMIRWKIRWKFVGAEAVGIYFAGQTSAKPGLGSSVSGSAK